MIVGKSAFDEPLLLFSRYVMSDSATPRTAAYQVFLSYTIFRSLLKLMSIESVSLNCPIPKMRRMSASDF